MEKYQLQLLSEVVTREIKPFLFTIPANIFFEREEDVVEQGFLATNTLCFLSLRRLVDGRKDLARQSHFFVAYSNRIIILLQFNPSAQCVLPKSCCIAREYGTYTIPEEKEAINLIPKGLWELHHSSALEYFQSVTEALRQLTPQAADKMISTEAFNTLTNEFFISDYTEQPDNDLEATRTELPMLETADADSTSSNTQDMDRDVVTIPFPLLVNKPQLSMLPPDFKIEKSFKSIQLPKGHQIVLHHVEDSSNLTIFLAVGDSIYQPYMIYLFDSSSKTRTYVDGSFITEVDNEVCLTNFLLEHSIYAEMRAQLKEIQERARAFLTPLLSKNQFISLQMFIHYLKHRWFIQDIDTLPSLGLKCPPKGCWYCKHLCHYCMKPASWLKVMDGSSTEDSQYRFCSKKCNEIVCRSPLVMPKSIFVVDHRDKFLQGNFKGPVLNIVQVCREEGNAQNTIDLISLCLGDGSEGLPQGTYILWQVRRIDSQYYRSFIITNAGVLTETLWSWLTENEEVITLYSKLRSHLLETL